MLPDWYAAWTKSHLVTFAIFADENVAAFASWWQAFQAMGCEADEMRMATVAVLNGGPAPIKISDHYHAIKRTILAGRSERQSALEKARRDSNDYGICCDCGNSGFVSVPHPAYCNAIEWRSYPSKSGEPIYPTAAVLCHCKIGRDTDTRQRQKAMENENFKTCMTVTDYADRVNGNWREQLREREESRRTLASVEASIPGESREATIARWTDSFSRATQ